MRLTSLPLIVVGLIASPVIDFAAGVLHEGGLAVAGMPRGRVEPRPLFRYQFDETIFEGATRSPRTRCSTTS